MDIGHTALQQMIIISMRFMRVNNTWPPFVRMMDLAFPKIGDTYALALHDDSLNPGGPPKKKDNLDGGSDDADDGGRNLVSPQTFFASLTNFANALCADFTPCSAAFMAGRERGFCF